MGKKRRWWMLLGGVVLLIGIAGVGWWLYEYGGLNYYMAAVEKINRLEGDEKVEALAQFEYGTKRGLQDDVPGLYGGIYAGMTKDRRGNAVVWVWSRGMLRRFVTDENSVYSYFEICSRLPAESSSESSFAVGRTGATTNPEYWKQELVKRGDYVSLFLAREGHGGTPGRLREVYGYEWWVFVPVNLEEVCGS